LLCLGGIASRFLSDYHRGRSRVCVNPCTLNRISPTIAQNLDVPVINSSISVRNLAQNEDPTAIGPDNEPSWGLMIRAIIDGHMTFVYEQVIATRGGELILEIAWRLPAGTGFGGVDPRYQDHNSFDADGDPDRFVIFHFHADHLVFRGEYRVGIYGVVAFHAQDFTDNTHPWRRIDGNRDTTRNRRSHIINCNTGDEATDQTLYWYPGDLTNGEVGNEALWTRVMTAFGNYLVQQNLLTAATFIDPERGGLTADLPDPTHCNRRHLSGQPRRRMFGPGGELGTPPSEDDQQDNDDI